VKTRLVWLGLVSAIACNSPTGPLGVSAALSSLQLQNGSATPIYYFAVERTSAALIDWAACTDAPTCPAVPAHARRMVPYDQIAGYVPGEREAIVYWWHLEPLGAGQFRADSIRAVVVAL
jgi:hypothetical protein